MCVAVQVVGTAMLWGTGTALGEVPPYLISKSAADAGHKAAAFAEIEEVRSHTGLQTTFDVQTAHAWLDAGCDGYISGN